MVVKSPLTGSKALFCDGFIEVSVHNPPESPPIIMSDKVTISFSSAQYTSGKSAVPASTPSSTKTEAI